MSQTEPESRSRWRWIAAGITLAAVLGAGTVAWHRHQAIAGTAQDGSVLVVGDQRGGAQALLQAAGQLDHVPYRIEWAQYPAAAPLLEALGAQALDLGSVGGQPFAFAYANATKIRVVYAARLTQGHGSPASAIIVPAASPLHRVEDLKHRRIATVRGSAGQDLALQLLERHGLTARDVTWVYLNNSDAKAALATGSIDAWSTWGSYVGYALLKDHQRTLADATELPAQTGFIVASDKAITTKHALIADFLGRVAQGHVWIKSHPDGYAHVLSQQTGLPEDVARFVVTEYATTRVPVDAQLAQEERAILERYRRAGLIEHVPDLSGAFDASFNLPPVSANQTPAPAAPPSAGPGH